MKNIRLNVTEKELALNFLTELQAEYREAKRIGDPRAEEMLAIVEKGYADVIANKLTEYSVAFLSAFYLWLNVGMPTVRIDAEACLN